MKKTILFISLLIVALWGCKKKFTGPEWDTEILTPLATTSLTVRDLIDTSSFVKSDENNLLSIVYTNDVYTLENPLDSLVSLQIAPYSTSLNLQSLLLADQNIADTTRVGVLLDGIDTSPFTIVDGSVYPSFFLPIINNALAGTGTTSNEIDISEFIVEAYPEQAFFDIRIENSTSFDLVDLSYSIKNTEDGKVLVSDVIDTIKSFSTYEDLGIDLTQTIGDDPVRGKLTIEVGDFSLSVDGGVPINFDEYLAFSASIYDLKVTRAIAQFPAQEVIDYGDIVEVMADGGAELTYAIIDSGVVNVRAFSTIPTDLHFQYQVPNISQNGEEFEFSSTVDNSFDTPENPKDTNFFFNNYEFDFTVPDSGLAFNAFENTIRGQIDATEGLLDISLSDSIGLTIAVTKIKPSYARGYLGGNTTNVSDTISLDIWEDINGELDFESVNIELEIDNQIGIDAEIIINNLTAINSETGQSETYSGSSGPFPIISAEENGLTFDAQKSIISLDNASDLLSILPDKFVFDLDITLNPLGKTEARDDFIHSGASIFSKINIDIPLVASVKNLILSDTSGFEIEDTETPVGFTEGTLSILVGNGFPLDMDLELIFLNDFDIVVHTLTSEEIIASAIVDPISQTVSEPTKSKISFAFDKTDLENLLSAKKMIANATFNSSENQKVKIYDYYSMDIQFVADFGYQVNTKN